MYEKAAAIAPRTVLRGSTSAGSCIEPENRRKRSDSSGKRKRGIPPWPWRTSMRESSKAI